MSISKIRENARAALAGKWGKGIGLLFAYLACSFLIALLQAIIEKIFLEQQLLNLIISIIVLLIEVPLGFGLTYSFIKLKRNEDVGAFNFVEIGFSNFARAWKIALRTILKLILPIILLSISIFVLGLGVIDVANSMLSGNPTDSTGSLFIFGLILYVVALIWCLVRGLLYSMTTFIAYDNANMRSLEVVNESSKIMKGNRWKYFLLNLSFVVWFLIPVILAVLGLETIGAISIIPLYVWIFPYMQVAYICFYEHLLGKNNNVEVGQNDNNESNIDPISEN